MTCIIRSRAAAILAGLCLWLGLSVTESSAWMTGGTEVSTLTPTVFGSTNCGVFTSYSRDEGLLQTTRLSVADPTTTNYVGGITFLNDLAGEAPIPTTNVVDANTLNSCSYISGVMDLAQKAETTTNFGTMTELSIYFTAIVANGETVAYDGESVTGDGTTRFSFSIKLAGAANAAPTLTTVFAVAPTGPTESDNLASQQSFFTPLIMNHQTYNMVSGVGSNLDSLFNGNGLAPLVSSTGFAFQSAGAGKWYEQRKKRLAEAKKQPVALDILANQNRAAQKRDVSTRADTTANLMAYQSSQENASTKETVEKLDAVAKDDIYAADVIPIDEDNVFQSPWNVWIKGSWSVYEAHDNASFDGHMLDVVGGVDYRLSDDLIVGVLGGYGVADFDTLTAGTAGSFDSDGYHAGVYLGKHLAPNLLLDALVAYTGSDYDNRSGTTTGSFNAHRVTIAAHLKGNIDWGMVTLQPTIGLMWASEKQDAYTDSAAVVQAARTVTAGRLSIGPKFIFQPTTTAFGMTQFWFATKGEYDFSNQNTSAASNLPDISDVASARVQAGLSVANDNGVSLSLQGDVSGLGSGEFIGYGGTVKVSMPF